MIKTGRDFIKELSPALFHFKLVFEAQSLAHAERDCEISSSQLSRVVKGMEEALGISLFERSKSGLLPNTEAKKLYKIICDLEVSFMKQFPPQLDPGERYTVTIGANSYSRATIVPRLIAKLYAVCKNTDFVVVPLEHESSTMNVDIALLSKPVAEGFQNHVLYNDSLWLIGDPQSPVSRLALGPDQMLNEMLVQMYPGPIPTIKSDCFYSLIDVATSSRVSTIVPGALVERGNVAVTKQPISGHYTVYANISKSSIDHPKLKPVRSLLDSVHLESA